MSIWKNSFFKEGEMKTMIAILLFKLGIPWKTSGGICGTTTRGYGELSDYGYWEYQIPYRYFKD